MEDVASKSTLMEANALKILVKNTGTAMVDESYLY